MNKAYLSGEQRRKRRSVVYKVVGGALLLLSFVIQNYSYDVWNTRLTEYMNANRDYAAMQRSSLLYQNLYFSLQQSDSIPQNEIRTAAIQNAAKHDVISRLILHTANEDKEDKHVAILEQIRKEVSFVKDYESYLSYLEKARGIDEFSLQDEEAQVKQDGEWKTVYRNIFLVTYVVGSVLLLVGFRYE